MRRTGNLIRFGRLTQVEKNQRRVRDLPGVGESTPRLVSIWRDLLKREQTFQEFSFDLSNNGNVCHKEQFLICHFCQIVWSKNCQTVNKIDSSYRFWLITHNVLCWQTLHALFRLGAPKPLQQICPPMPHRVKSIVDCSIVTQSSSVQISRTKSQQSAHPGLFTAQCHSLRKTIEVTLIAR